MRFLSHRPSPPLSGFVDQFWLSEGYAPSHAMERLLPTGTLELVINLREDRIRIYDGPDTASCRTMGGAVVCGAHSGFFVIDTAQQESVIGIHFRAGGAFPFLHLTAGELLNAHVPLESLWGSRAETLRDRLLEARTPDAKFRVLEQTLLAMADRRLMRHPAVTLALEELERVPATGSLRDLAERTGMCQRRFIRLFTEEVGLTPKLFARIRRFQEVLRLVERGGHINWARIAAACGYYDQAHFIRDFGLFSGINPTAYLVQRTPHRNHVPIFT
jgi:AraC-like DNA-binding protein